MRSEPPPLTYALPRPSTTISYAFARKLAHDRRAVQACSAGYQNHAILQILRRCPKDDPGQPRDAVEAKTRRGVRPVQQAGSWKIAGITLTVFYQEGNRSIPEFARARSSPEAEAIAE
jgi:hypothetical protein